MRAPLAPIGSPIGGAIVLARSGPRTLALIGDADTSSLHAVDVESGAELSRTALAGAPSQVLVLPDGRVVVALRERSTLELFDPGPTLEAPLVPSCRVAVPAEPVALGFASIGPLGSLVVVSRWAAKVTALAVPAGPAEWSLRTELAVARDPTALAVTKDRLVVLHATRGVIDDLPLSALGSQAERPLLARQITGQAPGEPSHARAPMAPRPVTTAVPRPPPPTPLLGTQGYGLAAAPDGTVYAALALAAPGPPSGAGSGYGGAASWETGAIVGELAVLEPSGELRGSPFLGQSGPSDCLLPRAAAFHARGSLLLVACAGLDVVIGYDARTPRPSGPRKDGRSRELPGERRTPRQAERWRGKVGSGPAGIAVDEARGRAWVWSAFDGTLTELALDDRRPRPHGDSFEGGDALVDANRRLRTVQVRKRPALPPEVLRGRVLFHAAGPARRIAADGRACASCHLDGRDDGLTWHTHDGPRQTPILLGRIEGTAPYGWSGDATLPEHFKRTLSRLGGVGLEDTERDAIFEYVASLSAPARVPADEALRRRGGELFASADVGCSTCHPMGQAVDGLVHDVRSRGGSDLRGAFDTPSLRFIGVSAPYFHDGRYATLEALLDGSSGTMGHTKQLPEADRKALLSYLDAL